MKAYFSYGALNFIRQLVTGGSSIEIEEQMASGHGLHKAHSQTASGDRSMLERRQRSRVAQIELTRDNPDPFGAFSVSDASLS